ncbi:hypothetical protein ABL78_7927 [Leptomonas seymouri]|uniref:Protein kinase domain-containing protein n=1 Tax=Leptomonas seymouri TaxID=5684 RepID=A0A0N1IGM5_LEPSE|nr:hypothetical protein ABL78_7927 [Leptomonas seymouri]|eukprot:KPI83053.1 hypothetical protein ABL78_7927 [Leptomonas seymouri]
MITPHQPRQSRKEVRLGKHPDVVYCEEDRIGQGQFGTVYRGRCPATDTIVAVKLLRYIPSTGASEIASPIGPDRSTAPDADSRDGAASTAKQRPRFPSELEILWALRGDQCPNIVHVLSVWSKPRKHHPTGGTATTGKGISSAAGGEVGGDPKSPSSSTAASSPRTAETRGRHSNVYVLVTEYCEGGDLQHRLQALDSNVPTQVARSFTYQLCNALYTLKRRRIVHRDIKPANLLLSSRDWETATLKVADFGMAKAAPPPRAVQNADRSTARRGSGAVTTVAEITEGGDAAAGLICDGDDDDESNSLRSTLFYSEMGTPMYMSPERIAGQPYDYKADVYSAGMVLLEMLRGSCVRVTRVSQLRKMVPDTIQRIRLRYAARGGEAPAWLDLVQRMTATDPALRYSVEDVLRHPWFTESVGRALPPLTFDLPPKVGRKGGEQAATGEAGKETEELANGATPDGHVSDVAAASSRGPSDQDSAAAPVVAVVEAKVSAAADATSLLPSAADAPPATPTKDAVHGATETVPLSAQVEAAEDEDNGFGASFPAGSGRRQEPPPHWSLLGVCTGVDPQCNAARFTYSVLPPKSKHSGPTLHNRKAALAMRPAALSLPAGCGPHVITHAVRGFVDSVYLYALQDELDPVRGLTLVSFLVELVQNGFGAYLECLESLGGGAGAITGTASAADGLPALENNGGACINGHRFVVKDVVGLPEVWQQLMVRLSHAEAAYTAQLPPRMLQCASFWRQRVLKTTTGAATAEDGVHAAGVEHNKLYASSTSSSDGESAMPGLPSVASITNVPAAACGATPSSATATATVTAGAGRSPLRVYTLSTRAEQLIFEKAVDCVQSEALAMLMATPVFPPHQCDGAEGGRRRPSESGGGDNELADATDCLEEEVATHIRHRPATPAPLSSSLPPGKRFPSMIAGAHTSVATPTFHSAMPPHRGIALLRVLLQRAVLSSAEVGLEPEGPFAARGCSLGASAAPPIVNQHGDPTNNPMTTPTRVSPSTATAASTAASSSLEGVDSEVSGYAFVVLVPVYAALHPSDVHVVENLLCAATRVFASSQRSA